MSGGLIEFITRAGDPYVGVCYGYEDDFVSSLFAAAYYAPAWITLVVVGLSISHFEVFYWLLTMVLFICVPINYGLRTLIGPSNNIQPPSCPITENQMPSSTVQLMTALSVVGWGFILILFPHRISNQKIAFFTFITVIVIYTNIYLLFNSTAQILAGAGEGLIEGVLYLYITHYLYKWGIVALIVRLPGLTMLGKPIDTMIDRNNPTVYVGQKFDTLNVIIEGS